MPHKPAPLARPFQVATVLKRAAPYSNSPEAQLILEVLAQAVWDAMSRDAHMAVWRGRAHLFFTSGTFRPFCELVGLEPDWVARVMREYGGVEG